MTSYGKSSVFLNLETELKKEADMKFLAIQGSPRSKEISSTEVILQEFLKGAQSQGAETETIYLREKEIHYCISCYTCWFKTPGVCGFKDDMPELLEKVRKCDVRVYATPLYNSTVTSLFKTFQERLLPLVDPHMIKPEGIYRHPQRYDLNQKMVLVSTCGFPEISHFDPLRNLFQGVERQGQLSLIGRVLVPAAGILLKNEPMRKEVKDILQAIFQAGVEVVREGRISKETEAKIQKPAAPADNIAETINSWFDRLLEGGHKK